MKRREIWGVALLTLAALAAWADHAIYEAYRAAARDDLLLYIGIPADSIASWFRIAALLAGAMGLFLLLPPLVGRIPRKIPRRIVGWTTVAAVAAAVPYFGLMFLFACLGAFGIGDTVKITAADGQSVLITQDGFDGDIVDIYTEYDELHYKRIPSTPDISRWPRVKDQNCQLETAGDQLKLTCGATTLVV
jgi:MFS family permease